MIILKKEKWVNIIKRRNPRSFDSGLMIAILITHLEYDCFKNSKLRTNPLNYTMINKKEKSLL